jgi:ring-1,2-phenylacetyl-CoA epoxidase subunit PaaB
VYGTVITVGEADATQQQPPRPATPDDGVAADGQWALWEVFTQESQGAPHEHAGSVRATDAEHALQNARDVYGRRGKVLSMWVVPTGAIHATTPDEAAPFFEPGDDKPYRHPHFYKVPRGVKGL